MQLMLIHQMPDTAPIPAGARTWRTCLREVVFLRDEPGHAHPPATLVEGDAYGLLLEIVSGLRSPLVGETQVQAQFKSFLASLDPAADSDVLRVGQRLLADVKSIRHQHFQGLGTREYGSLVAARVPPGRRIVLVGTGALAAEILEHLPRTHHIDRWGRTPHPGWNHYFLLTTAASRPVQSFDPVTMIVAAPVQTVDLQALLECYPQTMEIVDLRAADQRTPFTAVHRVVTLDDIFRQVEPLALETVRRIADARRDVLARGRAFRQREELRPFGWDDLCA
jgi:glutamyl-tRNA reductase